MSKQVIKFYSTWCGPCKVYGPTFNKVANELSEVASFQSVNVEENKELARQYGVKNIPMTVVIENGEVKSKTPGRLNEDTLKNLIVG